MLDMHGIFLLAQLLLDGTSFLMHIKMSGIAPIELVGIDSSRRARLV